MLNSKWHLPQNTYFSSFPSIYLYKRRHICMQISLTQLCECVYVQTLNLYSKTWDHMQIYYSNNFTNSFYNDKSSINSFFFATIHSSQVSLFHIKKSKGWWWTVSVGNDVISRNSQQHWEIDSNTTAKKYANVTEIPCKDLIGINMFHQPPKHTCSNKKELFYVLFLLLLHPEACITSNLSRARLLFHFLLFTHADYIFLLLWQRIHPNAAVAYIFFLWIWLAAMWRGIIPSTL